MIERTTGKLLRQIQLFVLRFRVARNVNDHSAPETARKKPDVTERPRLSRIGIRSDVGNDRTLRIVPLQIESAGAGEG
jgi:hypothetical protein